MASPSDDFIGQLVFPDDCLPPEAEYSTQNELKNAIDNWASSRGYHLIIQRSSVVKSGRKRITYVCDRQGEAPSTEAPRQRRTASRRIGCRFSIHVKELESTWKVQHRERPEFCKHNHEPSSSIMAHPGYRQITAMVHEDISGFVNAGIPARDIQTIIRQSEPDIPLTRRDIYNTIGNIRRSKYQGKSPINALISKLN